MSSILNNNSCKLKKSDTIEAHEWCIFRWSEGILITLSGRYDNESELKYFAKLSNLWTGAKPWLLGGGNFDGYKTQDICHWQILKKY